MVRPFKGSLMKADHPFLFPLSCGDTAGITGSLIGRSLRTRLPKTLDHLEPKRPAPDNVECPDKEVRRQQILCPLQPGDIRRGFKTWELRHVSTALPPSPVRASWRLPLRQHSRVALFRLSYADSADERERERERAEHGNRHHRSRRTCSPSY